MTQHTTSDSLVNLPEAPHGASAAGRSGTLFPRLLIGLIVLICTEVFSGASVAPGLWSPWTWLVTYWLYFAHFFFFTTLAVRTGRTSLGSLYLWGVLFGLYESWITKVIWHGYGGDGKLVLGNLGPYGFSELCVVFLFHPILAFLLPLATACVLCPPLGRFFPDLAWITGTARGARWGRVYLTLSCAGTLGLNSGGPVNLILNVAFILLLLFALTRLARKALAASDGRSLVVFGNRGFVGLCAYLLLLYGVTYFFIHPEGLPSAAVQGLTLAIYGLVIAGLKLHHRRESLPEPAPDADPAKLRRLLVLFATVLGLSLILSLILSFPPVKTLVCLAVVANSVVWTPMGFVLTALAFWQGRREESKPVPVLEEADSP